MSERMEKAMLLAEKCWGKALKAAPRFVEQYLEIAEQLLLENEEVTGDKFRRACALAKLRRPPSLHPNVWVSGVHALSLMGWVKKVGSTTPQESHNHMPAVTVWRSMLYKK